MMLVWRPVEDAPQNTSPVGTLVCTLPLGMERTLEMAHRIRSGRHERDARSNIGLIAKPIAVSTDTEKRRFQPQV